MHTTSPATAISCQRAASACHRRRANAAAACDRTSWRRHFFSMLLAGVKSYYRSKRTCAAHIKRTCAACSCGGARAVRPRHTTPIVHNCPSCNIVEHAHRAHIVHTLCTHRAHTVEHGATQHLFHRIRERRRRGRGSLSKGRRADTGLKYFVPTGRIIAQQPG